MIQLVGILALILAIFAIYKIASPSPRTSGLDKEDTKAVIVPKVDPITRREVAKWLPPCNSRVMGACGPTLNCCGCLFPKHL